MVPMHWVNVSVCGHVIFVALIHLPFVAVYKQLQQNTRINIETIYLLFPFYAWCVLLAMIGCPLCSVDPKSHL